MNKKDYNVKKTLVKGVMTRLKPNEFESDEDVWKTLEKGLWKMNIEELEALETIAHGHLPENEFRFFA